MHTLFLYLYVLVHPCHCILYTGSLRSPATVVKPLINTPTTSAQSGSTRLCDDEVDFNSNDGDGIDDKEKLSGASSSISDEDNITYESLV